MKTAELTSNFSSTIFTTCGLGSQVGSGFPVRRVGFRPQIGPYPPNRVYLFLSAVLDVLDGSIVSARKFYIDP